MKPSEPEAIEAGSLGVGRRDLHYGAEPQAGKQPGAWRGDVTGR